MGEDVMNSVYLSTSAGKSNKILARLLDNKQVNL
jgi:hypothetical protein